MKESRIKLALVSSLLAIFCIASTASARQPDPSPYDPIPPHSGYPCPGDDQNQDQDRGRREVYVGQYFRDQSLDLISLLRLDQAFQGARIQSVEVFLQDAGGASLSLIANGMIADQQYYLSSFTVLYPNQDIEVGYGLRGLYLGIRGKLYIERIAVTLDESGYPGDPGYPGNPGGPGYPPGQNEIVLQGRINQSFYGQGSVDLMRVTAVMNYRGYQVASVTVNGRSIDNSFSRAQLLMNGTIDGDILLSPQGGNYQTYPRGAYIVGRNLNSMNLLVNRSQINFIEVRLTRF